MQFMNIVSILFGYLQVIDGLSNLLFVLFPKAKYYPYFKGLRYWKYSRNLHLFHLSLHLHHILIWPGSYISF